MWTDNPIADFHSHSARQERELQRLPICCECKDPIQDEHYYLIGGEYYCPDCLDDNHRYYTEDYAS